MILLLFMVDIFMYIFPSHPMLHISLMDFITAESVPSWISIFGSNQQKKQEMWSSSVSEAASL